MKKKFLTYCTALALSLSLINPLNAEALDSNKLKENQIEIKDSTLETSDEFSFLSNELKGKKIVAIGDTNAAIKELAETKHSISKYLIEKEGYTTILMEVNLGTCDLLNDYVTGKDVQSNVALSSIGQWQLNSQEFLDFINWVKEHNSKVDESSKVKFDGYTVYDMEKVSSRVCDYMEKVDPTKENDYKSNMFKLTTLQLENGGSLTADYTPVINTVKDLQKDFLSKEAEYIGKSSKAEYNKNKTYLQTFIENINTLTGDFQKYERDKNTIKAFVNDSKDGKGILWTSSSNLVATTAKESSSSPAGFKKLGYYLDETFGDSIYKITTSFGSGEYLQGTDASNTNKLIVKNTDGEEKATINDLIKDVPSNNMFINLKNGRNGEKALYSSFESNNINFQPLISSNDSRVLKLESIFMDYEKDFDSLIFVKKGTYQNNLTLKVKTESKEEGENNTLLFGLIGILIVGSVVIIVLGRKKEKAKSPSDDNEDDFKI